MSAYTSGTGAGQYTGFGGSGTSNFQTAYSSGSNAAQTSMADRMSRGTGPSQMDGLDKATGAAICHLPPPPPPLFVLQLGF